MPSTVSTVLTPCAPKKPISAPLSIREVWSFGALRKSTRGYLSFIAASFCAQRFFFLCWIFFFCSGSGSLATHVPQCGQRLGEPRPRCSPHLGQR